MKQILLFLIKIYQATLSLDHGVLGRIFPNYRTCRYSPSCSQYGYEAIDKYGQFKGGWMTIRRIGRCNGWSDHDHYDPVP